MVEEVGAQGKRARQEGKASSVRLRRTLHAPAIGLIITAHGGDSSPGRRMLDPHRRGLSWAWIPWPSWIWFPRPLWAQISPSSWTPIWAQIYPPSVKTLTRAWLGKLGHKRSFNSNHCTYDHFVRQAGYQADVVDVAWAKARERCVQQNDAGRWARGALPILPFASKSPIFTSRV
jgi:hypothetical protein